MTAGALSRRLTRLGPASGVEHAALHRLRHGLATYLVDQGRLLKAQARLGHRDPATGKEYHNQYHDLLVIHNGKIHAGKEYLDTAHAQDVIVGSAMTAGS